MNACDLDKRIHTALWLALCLVFLQACSKPAPQPPAAQQQPAAAPNTQASESLDTIDPSLLEKLKNEHWTGDIDKMRERRYIRALVLYNKTNFFYDGPQPRGITYEALKEFEKFLNKKLDTGDKPIQMIFLQVSREDGINRMRDGRGEIGE